MTQDLDTLCRIEPPIIRQKNIGIIFKCLFVMNNKHFPIPIAIADERGQKGKVIRNSALKSISTEIYIYTSKNHISSKSEDEEDELDGSFWEMPSLTSLDTTFLLFLRVGPSCSSPISFIGD